MNKNVCVCYTSYKTLLHCGVLFLLTVSVIWSKTAHTQDGSPPKIDGVWTNPTLSPEDERWRIVDLACPSTGCTLPGFNYLQALLSDPKNEGRSAKELFLDMRDYEIKQNEGLLTPLGQKKLAEYDPSQGAALNCTPEGDSLRAQILAPILMQIEQMNDRVIISYEYWNAVRTIYLDGRNYPDGKPATRLGHSIGRYEGSTLIIETTHVIPNGIRVPGGGFAPSADAVYVERYTHNVDNGRLDLVLTIIDPVHFRKAYDRQKSYFPAPDDWELEEFVCEAITGEF